MNRPDMMTRWRHRARRALTLGALMMTLGAWGAACTDAEPSTDSQTHWLRACDSDAQCGDAALGLSCICGTCSKSCSDDAACAGTPEASSCFSSNTSTSMVQCGGLERAKNLCLPACDAETPGTCGQGQACVQGACMTLASLPTTMSCGQQTCQVGQQYCYSFTGGVPDPDGGANQSAECKAIPAACQATPTCACLMANGEFLTSCQEVWPGALNGGVQAPSPPPMRD